MLPSAQQFLNKAGSFGKFQIQTLIAIYSISFCCNGIAILCSLFVVYSPPHRCYIPFIDGLHNNLNPNTNASIKVESDTDIIQTMVYRYCSVDYSLIYCFCTSDFNFVNAMYYFFAKSDQVDSAIRPETAKGLYCLIC